MSKFSNVDFLCRIPTLKLMSSFSVKPDTITNSRPKTNMFADKYIGVMEYGIVFYSNRATHERAVRDAERMIHREINRDALVELERLKSICHKYDDGELLDSVYKVIDLCHGVAK